MERLWEIGAPATWGLLAAASICLLCAFVLLSHSLVRRKAYGDEWSGWLARGRLEWTVRGGLGLLFAGGLLWGITLNAPDAVMWALGGPGLAAAGAQVVALRGSAGAGGRS